MNTTTATRTKKKKKKSKKAKATTNTNIAETHVSDNLQMDPINQTVEEVMAITKKYQKDEIRKVVDMMWDCNLMYYDPQAVLDQLRIKDVQVIVRSPSKAVNPMCRETTMTKACRPQLKAIKPLLGHRRGKY